MKYKLILLLVYINIFFSCINKYETTNNYSSIKVFQAWSEVENLDHLDYWEKLAKHDLVFHDTYPINNSSWDPEFDEPLYRGLLTSLNSYSVEIARDINIELAELNPDLLKLVSLMYREGSFVSFENETENWWENGHFPPDSPYWLLDSDGKKVIGWGEDTNLNGKIDDNDEIKNYLIDFTNPEVQDLIAEQAFSLKESGLFDGVFFDWMSEGPTTDDATKPGWDPILSKEEELEARIAIIRKVRERCGDDFLIMGNTNFAQNETLAHLLNAVFMECYKYGYDKDYPFEQLKQIEDAVIFNQNNLAQPALVCLEGWRICEDYNADRATRITERDNPENLRLMRLFTTMSLTLTDGYVLFGDDNAIPHWDHSHNWYEFWDAPIGEAVTRYQTNYNEIEGLYIREFENGWAVYNLSGYNQTIEFNERVYSITGEIQRKSFTVNNMDGEIFLKMNYNLMTHAKD